MLRAECKSERGGRDISTTGDTTSCMRRFSRAKWVCEAATAEPRCFTHTYAAGTWDWGKLITAEGEGKSGFLYVLYVLYMCVYRCCTCVHVQRVYRRKIWHTKPPPPLLHSQIVQHRHSGTHPPGGELSSRPRCAREGLYVTAPMHVL